MSLLFYVEFVNYLTPSVSEELFVDTSRSPNIQINLDIIVPRVSCDCKCLFFNCFSMQNNNFVCVVLALDAMDSSGEQHLQIDHNIYKRKLDLDGKPIEEPKKENIIIAEIEPEVNKTDECGSCYGAAKDPKR